MPGAVIKSGASVKYAIIAENAVIENGASVGTEPSIAGTEGWGITVVGADITIGKNAKVGANNMITTNVKEGEEI